MSSKEYIGTAYPMKNIDKNDIIPIENIIAPLKDILLEQNWDIILKKMK